MAVCVPERAAEGGGEPSLERQEEVGGEEGVTVRDSSILCLQRLVPEGGGVCTS